MNTFHGDINSDSLKDSLQLLDSFVDVLAILHGSSIVLAGNKLQFDATCTTDGVKPADKYGQRVV